jgi:hypothetical protein
MKFNKWDKLSDEEKVAQVRMEVEAGASADGVVANTGSSFNTRPKPRDWEEALNQVTDDKHKLRCALMDILLTWNLTTGLASMENALHRAKEVLDATDAKHS